MKSRQVREEMRRPVMESRVNTGIGKRKVWHECEGGILRS